MNKSWKRIALALAATYCLTYGGSVAGFSEVLGFYNHLFTDAAILAAALFIVLALPVGLTATKSLHVAVSIAVVGFFIAYILSWYFMVAMIGI